MNYKTLCESFEKIESVSSRNEISALLAEIFKNTTPHEIDKVIYFLQGRITPKYVPIEFSIGEKQVLKIISEFFKIDLAEVNKSYSQIGDMGKLMLNLYTDHLNLGKIEDYSIDDIYHKLKALQAINGENSTNLKSDFILQLIAHLDPLSSKYLLRIILGNVGLGLSDKSIIDGLSIMCKGDKSIRDEIEFAFGRRCDLGHIAKELKLLFINSSVGFENYLNALTIIPGIPVASKLVEREKNTESVFKRLGECFIQPKYDGLRCQAHVYKNEGGDIEIKLFSRNLEEFTDSFPDVCSELKILFKDSGEQNMVLDSEVIGVNIETGKFLQFGETMKRKRKHSVDEYVKNIKVQMHVFDLLYFKKDLLETKIEDRFKILENIFSRKNDSILKLSETILANSSDVMAQYFEKYVMDDALEGLIAKKLGTIYEPGTRNFDWIKLKRSSDSALNDSVDAVVLGYYFGKGARSSLGFGKLLVGIYDPISDEYLSLCKVGNGFKDEDFKNYKSQLDKIKADPELVQKLYTKIPKQLQPDYWVEPRITTEIEADEITVSDLHSAGFSLRFPRIKIWGRDKDATQTTTVEELKNMFNLRYGKK